MPEPDIRIVDDGKYRWFKTVWYHGDGSVRSVRSIKGVYSGTFADDAAKNEIKLMLAAYDKPVLRETTSYGG